MKKSALALEDALKGGLKERNSPLGPEMAPNSPLEDVAWCIEDDGTEEGSPIVPNGTLV